MGNPKAGPYLGWLGGRRRPPAPDPRRPLPSVLLAQALDDTFPHKTPEHWLWLCVFNLNNQGRHLRGLPPVAPPVSCYATEGRAA